MAPASRAYPGLSSVTPLGWFHTESIGEFCRLSQAGHRTTACSCSAAAGTRGLTLAEGPYPFTAKRYTYPYTKNRMHLDHENLDVYRVSVEFAAWAYEICRGLNGADRHARDQLLRASQSICLNSAEGCGKVPSADRGRFLQIVGGSARECGTILDILARCRVLEETSFGQGKALLVRIVAMLTRMVQSSKQVREEGIVYGYVNENGYGAGDGQPMAGGDSASRNSTA